MSGGDAGRHRHVRYRDGWDWRGRCGSKWTLRVVAWVLERHLRRARSLGVVGVLVPWWRVALAIGMLGCLRTRRGVRHVRGVHLWCACVSVSGSTGVHLKMHLGVMWLLLRCRIVVDGHRSGVLSVGVLLRVHGRCRLSVRAR